MADDRAIEVICPECGEMLKVTDIEAFVRALHLRDACDAVSNIVGSDPK